ncbi:unnamed protein product, partial [Mesorhabditis spiculigera]
MDFGMLGYIRHGEPDQYWYDCSKKTLQQWYETGQRRPILAIYLAISGNVFLTTKCTLYGIAAQRNVS